MPFIELPAFVLDQMLSGPVCQSIAVNLQGLYDGFNRLHGITSGEHDDRLVARAKGQIYYSGTFGAGGAWTVAEGVNMTVANLASDTVGRGRATFGTTWSALSNATYAVICTAGCRGNLAPEVMAMEVRPFNRTTTTFDWSFVVDNGGWIEASPASFNVGGSSRYYGFACEVYGSAPGIT